MKPGAPPRGRRFHARPPLVFQIRGQRLCFGGSPAGGRRAQREVEMETKQGFLVLADISGFTALVTATELEHGPAIIADLLEAVIRRISPPLEIEGIEGDAV